MLERKVCHAHVEAGYDAFIVQLAADRGRNATRAPFFMMPCATMEVCSVDLVKRARVNVGIERGWWMMGTPVWQYY